MLFIVIYFVYHSLYSYIISHFIACVEIDLRTRFKINIEVLMLH